MNSQLFWRPCTPDDIPRIADLCNAANAVDDPARVVNTDDIEKLTDSSDPNRNALLVVDSKDHPAGFAAVLDPDYTPISHVVEATGVVHPGSRGLGIGSDLISWQQRRARELFAPAQAHPKAELPRWLSTEVSDSAIQANELLREHGFSKVRTWLEMARPLADPIPSPPIPEGVRITTPQNQSEGTWLAYNDSFRDHWGSSPDTRGAWLRREAREDYRPDLSFIAIGNDDSGREEVAGLAITRVDASEFAARGGSFAYIHLLGVRRAWRGRGIATALLLHAMAAFKAAGFERAELNVDSNSPTGAVRVYERLGFRTVHSHSTHVQTL